MNKKGIFLSLVFLILFFSAIAIVVSKSTDTKDTTKKEVEVIEEKIEIEKDSIYLVVGEKEQIKLSDNKEYSFFSLDEEIATVDASGFVSAIDAGNTKIIVKNSSGVTKEVSINVEPKVEKVIFEKEKLTIEKGKNIELNYSIEPVGAKVESIEFLSTNSEIVTIEDNNIIARNTGKATVTILINNEIKDTCDIEVIVYPESIKLSSDEYTIYVDESKLLNTIILPKESIVGEIKWTSSDNSVVDVDKNGYIYGVSKGEAEVTVELSDDIKYTSKVIVKPLLAKSVSLNKKSINLYVNDTYNFLATILPEKTDNKNIKWISSNTDIATIDKDGKVVAKKVGKTVITAQTSNGIKAIATVYVRNNTFDKTAIFFGDSITYGFLGTPKGYSWANYIGDNYDLKSVTNAGKSGWYISNVINEKWIITILKSYGRTNYDYVILHGGTNDIDVGAELGEFDIKDFSGKYDTTTFLGGLEYYIYTAKKQWPNAKIGYIINYETPLQSERRRELSPLYYENMKKVLKKWNIKYLDLFFGSTPSGVKYSDLLKVNTTTYISDKLHLNAAGYKLISPYIYDWMNTL